MDKFVLLAKQAVEEYVKTGRLARVPTEVPADFLRQTGVFVTIYTGRELRGCVGTYLPTRKNIAEEIISNAVAACSRDNRFYPVTKKELPKLNYEVSILSSPEPMKDPSQNDPKKYGVVVRCADGRCGLLLPNLNGVDYAEQQISIACRKGGIDPLANSVQYYRFTAEKHK